MRKLWYIKQAVLRPSGPSGTYGSELSNHHPMPHPGIFHSVPSFLRIRWYQVRHSRVVSSIELLSVSSDYLAASSFFDFCFFGLFPLFCEPISYWASWDLKNFELLHGPCLLARNLTLKYNAHPCKAELSRTGRPLIQRAESETVISGNRGLDQSEEAFCCLMLFLLYANQIWHRCGVYIRYPHWRWTPVGIYSSTNLSMEKSS